MASILISKILTEKQKTPFLEMDFSIEEYNAISIEPVDFEIPGNVKNAIFTSQNAVKQIMSPPAGQAGYEMGVMNCFCVGEKTKKLLEENDANIIAFAEYGKDLAKIIVKKYADWKFTFFCGNRRRDELPSILKANKVSLKEIEVYKTILNPKKFEQTFDGVLFFSPSGVESFCKENELKNSTVFCIGKTTASEAEKYTDKIMVAEEPTIESLIKKVMSSEL